MVDTQIPSLHPDCQSTKNRTLWLLESGEGRLRGLKGQITTQLLSKHHFLGWRAASGVLSLLLSYGKVQKYPEGLRCREGRG